MSLPTGILAERLAEQGWLLADGATGTNLFEVGLEAGYPPELWNTEQPEKISSLHEAFINAGADIILTNTFGGTAHRLKLHHAQDRVFELNRAGAALARSAADDYKARTGKTIIVAGSIGPTGELFEPMGALTFDTAVEAFAEQARGLKAGGADVAWIETMSALDEVRAAIIGAEQAGLTAVATMSFDTAGRTMMGITPQGFAEFAAVQPLTAFGANCGVGPAELVGGVLNMAQSCTKTVVAKGNCGMPQFKDGDICYSGTPALMGRYACLAYDAGARIIGGCCGTAPEHLAAMRAALTAHVPGTPPSLELLEAELGGTVTRLDAPAAESRAKRSGRRG